MKEKTGVLIGEHSGEKPLIKTKIDRGQFDGIDDYVVFGEDKTETTGNKSALSAGLDALIIEWQTTVNTYSERINKELPAGERETMEAIMDLMQSMIKQAEQLEGRI